VISWISGFMGAVCLGEGRATFKKFDSVVHQGG
jgi:hypothetical protein